MSLDKIRTGTGRKLRTEGLTETVLPIPYDAAAMPGAQVLGTDGRLYASTKIAGNYVWRELARVDPIVDDIPIYVKVGAPDRNLTQMLDLPPTVPERAIPTLARASEYANAVIGGNNQTAEVRIAAGGLHNPASVWDVNVRIVAYNAAMTQPIWPSNNAGTSTVPNNYFDGSGYADLENAVNFRPFSLLLRDSAAAANSTQILTNWLSFIFNKNVDFIGGFHFLGVAELIKLVANGVLSASDFVSGFGQFTYPSSSAYTTNTETNVDTFISELRVANNRTSLLYDSWVGNGLFVLQGDRKSVSRIRDCVFGPILPSHKESLGGPRDPMIAVDGETRVEIYNIYFRGKTTVTSTGMGVVNSVPLSGVAHYGSVAVAHPWTWTQTVHTFIGSRANSNAAITIEFGQRELNTSVFTNPLSPASFNRYADLTGKILPNSIHLLTSNGSLPANSDEGPFFDQFIHASSIIKIKDAWSNVFETTQTVGPRGSGFIGKFGSNGYNATKTRGLLGGNGGEFGVEKGLTFIYGTMPFTSDNAARTLFRKAPIANGAADSTVVPAYTPAVPEQGFGEGVPAGLNPVITTDNSGNAGLNMGLRSYRQGISPEFANTFPASNIVV